MTHRYVDTYVMMIIYIGKVFVNLSEICVKIHIIIVNMDLLLRIQDEQIEIQDGHGNVDEKLVKNFVKMDILCTMVVV